MKVNTLASILLALIALTACTDDELKPEDPVQPESTTQQKSNKDHSFTVDKDSGRLEFKASIVYFAFDDASLTPEGMARLDAIATHLQKHGDLGLVISGHCDERGSTEYNIALGQKRAENVRAYLKDHGMINAERLKSVSFGEEKPAATGHSEDSWAKNRRAEFSFTAAAH